MINKIKKELKKKSSKERAKNCTRYFKCEKGEYGEGDKFIGVIVPEQRNIANKYWRKIPLKEIEFLLKSSIHEHRQTALFILVKKYQSAEKKESEKIVKIYLKNIKFINNWDLVDLSAPKILGDFVLKNPSEKKLLYDKYLISKNLWKRRIAILCTNAFIQDDKFKDTFRMSKRLLDDQEDLIHKACGWMLREVGKKDQTELEFFLKKHYKKMPRTMLRYSIEKFSKTKRKAYLDEKI